MFKSSLYNIIREIEKLDPEMSMQKRIEERLEKSLSNYEGNLRDNYDYVISRSPLKVLKMISKK